MTTTHHIRIHYTDELAHGWDVAELIDLPRTVWVDEKMDFADEDSDDLSICEVLFSRFNRHDAADQSPLLDELGLRSMSVGDVVEIRGDAGPRFYLCAAVGFEAIEGVRSKTIGEL